MPWIAPKEEHVGGTMRIAWLGSWSLSVEPAVIGSEVTFVDPNLHAAEHIPCLRRPQSRLLSRSCLDEDLQRNPGLRLPSGHSEAHLKSAPRRSSFAASLRAHTSLAPDSTRMNAFPPIPDRSYHVRTPKPASFLERPHARTYGAPRPSVRGPTQRGDKCHGSNRALAPQHTG
uniref:Uncharacterized protein n=1 Tax=Mycena chlorophos TaxID=658473 RepID=A0ABQ0LVE8_MYCCL|nr:predicted protein [Mycena chlorophos]